ncbi:uncharacterized protein LOC100180355 isoform X1 [Ciona intestinalis]
MCTYDNTTALPINEYQTGHREARMSENVGIDQNDVCIPNNNEVYRDVDGFLISLTPYTWDVIQHKVEADDLLFGRSVAGTLKYKEEIARIKDQWLSIDDFCKHHFLGYPMKSKEVTNEQNVSKSVFFVDHSEAGRGHSVRLEKNNYPYYLNDGIEQFVLWADNYLPTVAEAKEIFAQTYPNQRYEILVFENQSMNKSVKNVMHLHILARLSPAL